MLLRRGARRVYALDVGRGQLADRLRRDERVVSMERHNARTLTADSLPEPVDLAVIDVAFISLGLVLGPVRSVLRDGAGPIVALVKPQFEAGRADVKGGVVRDATVHRDVLRQVTLAPGSWVSAPARSSPRPSRARRATASSSSTCRPGRRARSSTG